MRSAFISTILVTCLIWGLAPSFSLADTADTPSSGAKAGKSSDNTDSAADITTSTGLQVFGGLGTGANFNYNGKGSGTQADVNGYVEAELHHFYIGAFGDVYNTKASNEVDLYFGYRSETAGGLSYDVNYYRYYFPNDAGSNSGELGLSLGKSLNDKLSAKLDLGYDPQSTLGEAHLGLEYGLTDKITLEAKVGALQNDGAKTSKEWQVGVGYALNDKTGLELTYYNGNDYAAGYIGLALNFDTTILSR